MFTVNGASKLGILIFSCFMKDPKFERTGSVGASIQATWSDIWSTMTLLRVLWPIIFVMVFALSPSNSDAFNSYIIQEPELCGWHADNATHCQGLYNENTEKVEYSDYCSQFDNSHVCDTQWGGLGFNAFSYSMMGILGNIGSVLGNYVFKTCLINSNWHGMFAGVVTIASAVACLQLLLMFRNDETGKTINEQAGIPDIVFALGDDIVMAISHQLLSMPILILMARLCPPGAEGTVYALVTSIQGVGGTVAGIFSKILTSSFDITNTDFSRLWQLTLTCALLKLTAILFLPLVPRSLDSDKSDRRHPLAGIFLLFCFFGGLGWALLSIILSVI